MAQNSVNNTFLGTGVEDAYNIFLNATPQTYAHGIDTSDANSLKITDGATPSAGNVFRKLFTTGERILPLQPAFFVQLTGTSTNVTGAGGAYFLGTAGGGTTSTVLDQGGNITIPAGVVTFTAPVAGLYSFTANMTFSSISVAMTSGSITLNFSGAVTAAALWSGNPGVIASAGNLTMVGSMIVPLAAAETVTFAVAISGGAGNDVEVVGAAAAYFSWFSGFLLG